MDQGSGYERALIYMSASSFAESLPEAPRPLRREAVRGMVEV
jgi:hypothetical protein